MNLAALGTVLAVLLVSSLAGWGIVSRVLSWARVPDLPADRVPSPGGRPASVLSPARPPAVLRGGTWIGILERIAVTGALLSGQTLLVGAVVAIKGLGRWAELRDNPGLTERFIIGTLASLTWAGACGLVGRVILGWILRIG